MRISFGESVNGLHEAGGLIDLYDWPLMPADLSAL